MVVLAAISSRVLDRTCKRTCSLAQKPLIAIGICLFRMLPIAEVTAITANTGNLITLARRMLVLHSPQLTQPKEARGDGLCGSKMSLVRSAHFLSLVTYVMDRLAYSASDVGARNWLQRWRQLDPSSASGCTGRFGCQLAARTQGDLVQISTNQ